MRFYLRHFLAPICIFFVCVGQVWALSLGNITVISAADQPFEAKINIKLSDSDVDTLGPLEVKDADSRVYEKLGISRVESKEELQFKIIKSTSGLPEYIKVSSKIPLAQTKSLFQDVVIEVRWKSGLLRRVYTILSDKNKNITVSDGTSLGELAAKLRPDVGGASFDQTLIALYRANPQAFVSGNIHRLKAGEILRVPSVAMVKSIPLEESKSIVELSNQNYASGQINKSTEDINAPAKDLVSASRDRLNIGSSVDKTVLDQQLTTQIEDLVAQEKLLADAKQRIAEIEKNISDLKKLSSKSKETNLFSSIDGAFKITLYALLIALVSLGTFGLLKFLTRDKLTAPVNALGDSSEVPRPNFPPAEVAAITSDRAKALFAGIDLDLNTSPKATPKKLTASELRVKLNLAKSYLKIDDAVMAKLILDELIAGDLATVNDVTKEARQLRSTILV